MTRETWVWRVSTGSETPPDFAPPSVQKAVEMGASSLQPVLTRHTQVNRVNCERMRANVIEAAEQCGILSLAEVAEPVTLDRYLGQRNATACWCSATKPPRSPIRCRRCEANAGLRRDRHPDRPRGRICRGRARASVAAAAILRLSLGPRILRADTAGVAALALVQAALGDWAGSAYSVRGPLIIVRY